MGQVKIMGGEKGCPKRRRDGFFLRRPPLDLCADLRLLVFEAALDVDEDQHNEAEAAEYDAEAKDSPEA